MRAGQGFDGLLITPLGVYVIEIKNPEQHWKFEPSEQKLCDEMERLGQKYHVIETMEDAKYIAGVI